MAPTKVLMRVVFPPVCGLILMVAGGCGDGATTADMDPDGGNKLKQARINAYGKAGFESSKGKPGGSGGGAQGNARRAGR